MNQGMNIQPAQRAIERAAAASLALLASIAIALPGCLGSYRSSPQPGASILPSSAPVASPTTPISTQSQTVSMQNLAFIPKTLTLAKGTTVTFTNKDSVPHTVTPDTTGAFAGITNLDPGQSGQIIFSTAGTFPYHCAYHGNPGSGMAGTITVQ